MKIIEYLNQHFYNLDQLLELTQVSKQSLRRYQSKLLMPKASYYIDFQLSCRSFFGKHQQHQSYEYYAKGYGAWLAFVDTRSDGKAVYQHFHRRYQTRVSQLIAQDGLFNIELVEDLDSHIANEWQHFLDGTYGLCTRTGLPEDIAAKELAIMQINQLKDHLRLTAQQRKQLIAAVDLLDSVSALFAPHERTQSSRERLINQVRRQHQLPTSH